MYVRLAPSRNAPPKAPLSDTLFPTTYLTLSFDISAFRVSFSKDEVLESILKYGMHDLKN